MRLVALDLIRCFSVIQSGTLTPPVVRKKVVPGFFVVKQHGMLVPPTRNERYMSSPKLRGMHSRETVEIHDFGNNAQAPLCLLDKAERQGVENHVDILCST